MIKTHSSLLTLHQEYKKLLAAYEFLHVLRFKGAGEGELLLFVQHPFFIIANQLILQCDRSHSKGQLEYTSSIPQGNLLLTTHRKTYPLG